MNADEKIKVLTTFSCKMSSTRRVSIELPCLRKSRSSSYSDDISDAPYVGSDCATDSPASVESVTGAYYRSSPSPCSKTLSSIRVEELSKTWGFGEVDPLGAREPPVLNSKGSINEELYGNLIPLMETFMDQKENQRALLHHAPLVYTRAPHRESPAKNELPAEKLKKNKQQRASSKSNAEAKAEEGPVGRSTGSDGHAGDEPDLSMKLNKAELLKLQSQVEELKRKVRDKEEILQSIKQYDIKVVQEVDRAEVLELRTKTEGLQKELLKRDFLLHSVQHQLFEKHAQIADMKLILEGLQNDVSRRDHRVSLMENHLDELRFEVAALRYQSQVAENRGTISQLDQTSVQDGLDDFDGNMENARRRYLAAVIAARNKPVDESIALAAEFRNQLRGFVPQLSQALPE